MVNKDTYIQCFNVYLTDMKKDVYAILYFLLHGWGVLTLLDIRYVITRNDIHKVK